MSDAPIAAQIVSGIGAIEKDILRRASWIASKHLKWNDGRPFHSLGPNQAYITLEVTVPGKPPITMRFTNEEVRDSASGAINARTSAQIRAYLRRLK